MLDYINIDKVKNKIKEITSGIPPVEMSAKGKKISTLIKDMNFGPKTTSSWAKLFSEVIGEKITISCKKVVPIGTMLVPISNPNKQNYTLDEPFLVEANANYGLKITGKVGNTIYITKPDVVRKATNDEIDYFFKCFDYTCGKKYISNLITKL